MKITIITDHRFYRVGLNVYDDYVFNYNFFKTYLGVFDEVNVVCRVKNAEKLDSKWILASGMNVNFIDIPDVHGIRWLFGSKKYFKEKYSCIFDTDCFCFRVPSTASWEVFKLNQTKSLPYMFEAIGDPEDAMTSSKESWFKGLAYKFLGNVLKKRMQAIILNGRTGSYVSLQHLQNKYSVRDNVITDSISSIRLNIDYLLNTEKIFNLDRIRIIHVGSFIALKNQKDLIYSLKYLRDNKLNIELDFVGEGTTKIDCQKLVENLGLSNVVKFHGQVTGFDNIVKLLDNADLFVLPSSNEGMPRALIEGMARGLVCFGSNVGGVAELLPQQFTFSPGNLAEINTVLSDFLKGSKLDAYNKISEHNIKVASSFTNDILENKRKKILINLKNCIANERD